MLSGLAWDFYHVCFCYLNPHVGLLTTCYTISLVDMSFSTQQDWSMMVLPILLLMENKIQRQESILCPWYFLCFFSPRIVEHWGIMVGGKSCEGVLTCSCNGIFPEDSQGYQSCLCAFVSLPLRIILSHQKENIQRLWWSSLLFCQSITTTALSTGKHCKIDWVASDFTACNLTSGWMPDDPSYCILSVLKWKINNQAISKGISELTTFWW